MIDITKYKQHIYEVVGAIHEVHKELGPGLNENCYQEGLQMELEEQGIPFLREMMFNYMRLLRFPFGILVNFTPKFAEIERYFLDLNTMEIIGTDGKVKQFL